MTLGELRAIVGAHGLRQFIHLPVRVFYADLPCRIRSIDSRGANLYVPERPVRPFYDYDANVHFDLDLVDLLCLE